jgi:hypothetical protein
MDVNRVIPSFPLLLYFLWTISFQMLHLVSQIFSVGLRYPLLLHLPEVLNVLLPVFNCLFVVGFGLGCVQHLYPNLYLTPLQLLVESVGCIGVTKARNHVRLLEVDVTRVTEVLQVLGGMVFCFGDVFAQIRQSEDGVGGERVAQLGGFGCARRRGEQLGVHLG